METTVQTFEEWMAEVDARIERAYGMSYRDLPDMPYRDEFDDGASPTTMARRALRNAMADVTA